MAFTLYAEWIFGRFYGMFREVFGDDFVTGAERYDAAGLYAGGKGARAWLAQAPSVWKPVSLDEDQIPELPTDDWPFLYKEDRTIPREYAIMLGLLLAMLVLGGRGALGRGAGWDGQMAALGAGFLLIEVRGLAALALLFGSTWIVNAIVITMILVMALVGNALASAWRRPPVRALYVLLWFAVLLNFAVPPSVFLEWGRLSRSLAGGALVALPLCFSGVIFSVAFRDTRDKEGALGSNLLGAVAGGMSEYASMMTGIRALSLLALAFYIVAFLVHQRRASSGPGSTPRPSSG